MMFILSPFHESHIHRGKKVHGSTCRALDDAGTFSNLCACVCVCMCGLSLKECTSSFAPASQQRIKRLKPTNTRLKQQFEEFWEPKKTQRGAGLCSFSATQNCSDWCLTLVFVGFNLLILCWLAGANDEVHSFKFYPP